MEVLIVVSSTIVLCIALGEFLVHLYAKRRGISHSEAAVEIYYNCHPREKFYRDQMRECERRMRECLEPSEEDITKLLEQKE